ncbi:MAG: PD40 domain-containing protein, partial [Planctomycetes bacterium]|nr:PD40 domain-containing protein [Planctomycetota bacterium]
MMTSSASSADRERLWKILTIRLQGERSGSLQCPYPEPLVPVPVRKWQPMRLDTWLVLVLITTASTAMGATVYEDLGRPGTHPSLSADGGRLVFEDQGAIWLYERSTRATTRLDRTASAVANGESSQPVISSDGSVVAFISFGSNLVTGDTNNQQDVFARVLATGAIQRVSVRTDGSQTSSQFGAYFHLS